MAKISDLSDELLVKILSFIPTKVAVSTSILSKQWEFLWMWLPNLKFDYIDDSVRDFINKNLPLHRAPILNSFRLTISNYFLQAETLKSWIEIAVSRRVCELSIITCLNFFQRKHAEFLLLPSSLFTCNSLVTLELAGEKVLLDVPQTVGLPSLKTLGLGGVTYSNEDSLRLLLSHCPVLEDLTIDLEEEENVRALVIIIPSLQRLSLIIPEWCSSDGYVIVTPSLKYFEVYDYRKDTSYEIEHMPKLEEASITVGNDTYIEKLLKSITTVKRLSLRVEVNSGNETVYGGGIVFSRLENLKLVIFRENWSKILFQLLRDSPNLQILDLKVDDYQESDGEYNPASWSNDPSLVPECLLKSLKTFMFGGSTEEEEERDFLSYIFKHARCLKSSSIEA